MNLLRDLLRGLLKTETGPMVLDIISHTSFTSWFRRVFYNTEIFIRLSLTFLLSCLSIYSAACSLNLTMRPELDNSAYLVRMILYSTVSSGQILLARYADTSSPVSCVNVVKLQIYNQLAIFNQLTYPRNHFIALGQTCLVIFLY